MPAKRSILEKKEHKVVANELPDEISQAHSPKSFPEPPEYHQEGFQVNGFKSYTDDYQYLRDPKDKRTKEALKLENRYAKAFLSRPKFTALHRELFREMKSMVGASEVSLPVREGNFWYFTRYEENEEYPLHCRRPCDPERGINPNFLDEVSEWHITHQNGEPLPRYPDEVIFLDLNLLMRELNVQYIEVGDMDISFDETKIAVTLDCSGGEEIFTLFIFEIQDVNYRRWLHTGASDAQKTWTRSLIETGRSIYTPMPSSRSNRSSPASPLSGPRRTLKKRASDGKEKISTGASFPCASFVEDVSPPPRHRCLQKIELFDLAGDVLWVNPTCVVYSVLNEKLRPHQIVFHDTAVDPSDPNAAWICYEAEDEAFWVLTISFTADDRYFIFCCASTEVSRWFICPTENVTIPSGAAAGGVSEHPRGAVLKVPFFCKRMEWMERHARESSLEHAEAVVSTAESNRSVDFRAQCAPTARFPAHGESPVEYHLDHHVRLLGPGEHHGGWIMTSNARGCTNFAVFFLPDENAVFEWETVSPTSPAMGAGDHAIANAPEKAPKSPKASAKETKPPSLSTEAKGMGSDDWPLLFEYDPATKVESVECFEHFLLINVCRDASSEVLFCPMDLIWDWWARTRSREHTPKDPCGPVASNPLVKTAFSETHNRPAGGDDFPGPLRLNQTLLLSSLLLRRGAHLKAGGEWLHVDLHDELMRAEESVVVDSDFASMVSPAPPTGTVARDGGGFPPPSFFERLAASNAVGDGGIGGAESASGALPPPGFARRRCGRAARAPPPTSASPRGRSCWPFPISSAPRRITNGGMRARKAGSPDARPRLPCGCSVGRPSKDGPTTPRPTTASCCGCLPMTPSRGPAGPRCCGPSPSKPPPRWFKSRSLRSAARIAFTPDAMARW
ncbi:unnamed protein product [Phytomonas sp. EM1]|nr:unnamed protein product [Phytomonas sp. EM1]|eukprot:CCW62352.1 unnamed protein product [Phytomonas sp. isolate EM1]